MRRRPRVGIALPAALAAIVLLGGVAALAHASAMAGLAEAIAVTRAAQDEATRASLRARAAVALARRPRNELTAGPLPVGQGDTLLVVAPLTWPWHRVSVVVAGADVIAEVASGSRAELPWCAAAVVAGDLAAPVGAIAADLGWACPGLTARETDTALAEFDSTLVARSVLGAARDTVVVAALPAPPSVIRALVRLEVSPGGAVAGVLVAPVVRIRAGSSVRGAVVARDSLIVEPGGTLTGDLALAGEALTAYGALRLVGRRGLLLPP